MCEVLSVTFTSAAGDFKIDVAAKPAECPGIACQNMPSTERSSGSPNCAPKVSANSLQDVASAALHRPAPSGPKVQCLQAESALAPTMALRLPVMQSLQAAESGPLQLLGALGKQANAPSLPQRLALQGLNFLAPAAPVTMLHLPVMHLVHLSALAVFHRPAVHALDLLEDAAPIAWLHRPAVQAGQAVVPNTALQRLCSQR